MRTSSPEIIHKNNVSRISSVCINCIPGCTLLGKSNLLNENFHLDVKLNDKCKKSLDFGKHSEKYKNQSNEFVVSPLNFGQLCS